MSNRAERIGNIARGMAVGLLVAGCATAVFGVPAKRTPIVVTQPDGSELTIRLQGDERSHFIYSEDGYLLMHSEELGYVYAKIDETGIASASNVMAHNAAERNMTERTLLTGISEDMTAGAVKRIAQEREANSERVSATRGPGLSATTFPSKGVQKGLVILVEFKDVKFGQYNKTEYHYDNIEEGDAHTYFSNMLNKEGFSAFGGTGSCRDWFMANSRDAQGKSQFEPTFDLFGPVTLSKSMAFYGRNNVYGNDSNPGKMVIEACQALDADIDFSEYDRDGDGVIDNIYVFYAGYGEADGGGSDTIWPHSWEISSQGGTREYFDGKLLDHYACSNETDYTAKRPDGVGTFIHEFSHVMGLPDLYCTSNATAPFTPDMYSVMDYGPYNNNGRTPPNYSAYERYALDWITPSKLGAPGSKELDNLGDTNHAYIINTEKKNEFYLVENRQQKGWDKYLPGHGMLIWHVDYVQKIFDDNRVNNTASHQYVDLIEANGKKSVYYQGGFPFPGTSNVTSYDFISWNDIDTGVGFTNIAEKNGQIVFDARNDNYDPNDENSIDEILGDIDGEAVWYTLQGVRVAAPSVGMHICVKGGKAAKVLVK